MLFVVEDPYAFAIVTSPLNAIMKDKVKINCVIKRFLHAYLDKRA